MAFKVHTEARHHFLATGSAGKDFKIAKGGLSPARLASYQAMCKGGVVKMAEGGPVDPLDSLETDEEAIASAKKRADATPVVKPNDPRVVNLSFDDDGKVKPQKPPPKKYAGGGTIAGDPAVDEAIDQSAVDPAPQRVASPISRAGDWLTTPVTYTPEEVEQRRAAVANVAKSLVHNPEAYSGVKIPPSVPPEQALSYLSDQARSGNFQAPPIITAQAAYHGTPHAWEGPGAPLEAAKGKTFDLTKMGTGEGAQAVGWGLYASKSADVADADYRHALSMSKAPTSIVVDGHPVDFWADKVAPDAADNARHMVGILVANGVPPVEAIARSKATLAAWKSQPAEWTATGRSYLDSLDPSSISIAREPGRLYKLDAPEDHELLHWDAPLNDQPAPVKDLLHKAGLMVDNPDKRASVLYSELAARRPIRGIPGSGQGDQQAASEYLRSIGIPGHLYGSKSAGVENMVIYDPARAPVIDAATSLAEARKKDPKFSKGGAVGGGMDLSKHKLIEETGAHWHVQGPSGAFKVAKSGLSPHIRDQIAQHFAQGGCVQNFDEGGSVPDPVADAISQPPPDIDPAAQAAIEQSTVDPTSAVPGGGFPSVGTPPTLTTDSIRQALSSAPAGAWLVDANGQPVRAPAASEPAAAAAVAPAGDSNALVNSPLDPHLVRASQAMQDLRGTQAAPTAPQRSPGINTGGAPAIQREIADAYHKAAAAEQAKVDVVRQEAAATAKAQDDIIQQRQALQKQWQETWQGWQQRADQMRQDILDQKIDPRRYLNEKSTGGKISAAIGLLLGGIGSGLTHQPNAALEVINKSIDRDLEAQKMDLGKKQTLLGFHMQQGNSLMASHQLARADLLDVAAAQLQRVATTFAGDKAQAEASAHVASLQREAALTRQQVAATGLQMAVHGQTLQQSAQMFPYQLRGAQIGAASQELQFNALDQLTRGTVQAGQNGKMGASLDPRVITYLNPAIQEKLVALPDGSYAMARTPKGAEEASKTFEGAAILKDKIARYSALLNDHKSGIYGLDRSGKAAAKSLRDSIVTDINALAGLNRFTDTEAGFYKGRVPDITDVQVSSAHQAQLSELGKDIDAKLWAVQRANLNLPSAPRTLR